MSNDWDEEDYTELGFIECFANFGFVIMTGLIVGFVVIMANLIEALCTLGSTDDPEQRP